MMRVFLLAVLTVFVWAQGAAKPMEPFSKYNVILVHGAAPSGSGFESRQIAIADSAEFMYH
ncbi:MAG: hypothetical protein WCS54_05155 [Fibrobacteraceae bacterium]